MCVSKKLAPIWSKVDGGAYQIGKRWTEVHISESSLVVPTLCPQKQGLVSLSRQSYALTRNSSKNVFYNTS